MKKLALLCLIACGTMQTTLAQTTPVNLTDIKFTVAEAPEWSAMLKRDKGWFGGDGIYSIPLNGVEGKQAKANDKILFIFSDTMVGEIKDNTMAPGYKMIHNSVAILDGNRPQPDKMKFYWDTDAKGEAESVFIPKTPKTDTSDYYWLGDGFVNEADKATYIFGYRVRNVAKAAFGFREVGNTIIKIPAGSKPPYKDLKQTDSPFYLQGEGDDIGSYGTGIYVNTKAAGAPKPDGYIYTYGVRGVYKKMSVARVKPEDFENFAKWTYWDGKAWVSDIDKAATLIDGVSNELSFSALPDGRYVLVHQGWGMSSDVYMRLAASPVGPFGPPIKVWNTKPDLEEKTFVVYNGKAHPSLSKPGELIISYNINSVEFIKDLTKHPYLYRPRFVRVKFE
ncbi:DUF4185 domain-containing protein [Mucilaginibacter pedocola]|uniref:DUF4185 domain-containing protein n=1 Tax=Mucilaginibacter pedocola TaxID=1792845 RepID=A0A1S9P780_9SPHI|nr:DUF4185 domain-containing protein [Mucilaginibacter pedocola]OOQ56811.1 hypothetical protein BC343_17665 [Mucilaginibacter pedocola]